jgi:hypothetical protein
MLRGVGRLPPVEKAIFLPQRFRGLVSGSNILWFGPVVDGRRFSADVPSGVAFTDRSLDAALQIGVFLGFSEIVVGEELASGIGRRLDELVDELAAHGCRVRRGCAPQLHGTPADEASPQQIEKSAR